MLRLHQLKSDITITIFQHGLIGNNRCRITRIEDRIVKTYKCWPCAFRFTEADSAWDRAIASGCCPNCGLALRDFPAEIKQQHEMSSGDDPVTTTPMAVMNHEQLADAKKLFFILLGVNIAITAVVGFKAFSTIKFL